MPRGGAGRIKGSQGERARARKELRAALLAAARELAEESQGFEAVTIRKVADRVGYAAPVVYEYFANKRDLLHAVVTNGFADLADRLDAAEPTVEAAAAVVWDFAVEEPYRYHLMHSLADVPFGTSGTPASAVRCFELLKAAVTAAAPDHFASTVDDDAATDLFWAQAHGLITLAFNGRVKGGRERARALLDCVATALRTPSQADSLSRGHE
ncbi:TetR/AcrR family transcriptional regulator [Allokutzneria sp. A3M-2-11 16]|uniref:TetR/AcrR family transcriptional regulator n=1 Tax=Allokutzneria sp. A3M-2-11 16 TaxID=2962043 RepID=UPI0020B7AD36|nr:TetR/AcrR family transcriptional regulator [Allokutzneria sp. A3M-2-11 16]MCP3803416.1 TetR/AcrR family transcriptional regulator [Allokutzneria sp. A3M-2-11 16]